MANNKYYYAAYTFAPDEIAIFADEKKRDAWVNCDDEMSKLFPPLEMGRKRTSLKAKDVFSKYSVQMYNKKRWQGDPDYKGMFWLLPAMNRHQREERHNKYTRMAASELYNSLSRPAPTRQTASDEITELKEKLRREILEEIGIQKFTVAITETFTHDVTVYARNEEEAKEKARNLWDLGEESPDYDIDFDGVEFEIL